MSLFTDDNQYQDTYCCKHTDTVDRPSEHLKAMFIHVEDMFIARCRRFYMLQCMSFVIMTFYSSNNKHVFSYQNNRL